MYLSTHYGRHPTATRADYTEFSSPDGLVHAMVRLLFFRRLINHTLVVLHLSARCEQLGPNEEDKNCTGRGIST